MEMSADVAQLRVALAAMPTLAGDILRSAFARTPGIRVVGEYAEADKFLCDHVDVDVVILGLRGEEHDRLIPPRILAAIPQARVVTVKVNGGGISLHALRPHCAELGELSPDALVRALRPTGPTSVTWHYRG